jgi:hypothetical protein
MKKNALSSIFGPKVRKRTISYVLVLALFVIVQILRSSGSLTRQITSLLVPVCAYTVAAIGLNMNVGISGELNLGQAGFMSVGGFSAVVCSSVLSGSVTSGPVRLLISIVCRRIDCRRDRLADQHSGLEAAGRLSCHRDPGIRPDHDVRCHKLICRRMMQPVFISALLITR